jgi:hypothetical protein
MVQLTGWSVRCVVIAVCLFAAGCGRGEVRFDVGNARAHVSMLAGTIGSRPAGSEAGGKARNYLIDQLRLYGFDVRVQETDAVRADRGTTARVANIIAFKAGQHREAIGLVAHYDSVPEGPGAADDGLGAAVLLEAARVLSAKPNRNYSLLVLLTDGEELDLMGAAAAVTDPEIKERLQAYLNVEAIGSAAPTVLFESGPNALPLLRAWSRGAPQPRGGSYAIEIYKRLPNDTDFTMLRGASIPGLNFAAIGDGYAYHTSRDTPDRLTNEALRHTGETVVGTLDTLDAGELPARGEVAATMNAESPRYFDFGFGLGGGFGGAFAAGLLPLPQTAFVLGATSSRVLTVIAILIGLFAWVRLLRAIFQVGALRVIVSLIWMALAVAGSALAVAAAAWLLRHGRAVFHPWYAHPDRFLLLLVVSGIAVWWYVTRLMYLLPERWRSLRAPAAVWVVTLPIWMALAGFMEYAAPAAALQWSVPLLVAGILLAIVPPGMPLLVRFVSLLIAMAACGIWLRASHDLFVFLPGIFSRLPIIAPFWVYPAYVIFCAIVLAPPVLAMVTGIVRGRMMQSIASGVLLVALAVSMGLAYFAEAYTAARPQRRDARYVADVQAKKAWWEIAGNEPGLDLNLTPAEAPRWRPQPERTPPPATTLAMPAMRRPFVFRADADPVDPPADVAMSAITQGDKTELDVTVMPKMESLHATFILPAGVEPLQANLAGVQNAGAWRARFLAMPSTGVAFRATVPTAQAARLAETTVLLIASRLPGADQPRWPVWLPRDRTEWMLTTQWIVRPTITTKEEPVPPPPATPAPMPGATLPSPTLPPATTLPGVPPAPR